MIGAPPPTPVSYLESRQASNGGFAEAGGSPSPQLSAYAVLGLRAAGASLPPSALEYLQRHESALADLTDVELAAMAQSVLGGRPDRLVARIERREHRNGSIGSNVASTVWGILALRQTGHPAPRVAVRYVLRHQARNGGWSWYAGVLPDSNDTAAAVQALRSAGVKGRPIRRALTYLRRLRNRDGGFELVPGRGSDAQSTAWTVQAFLAAGKAPPRGSLRYLQRLRRPDGSFRYSARYVTTPVWVTAQVVPALAGKPFPLRS